MITSLGGAALRFLALFFCLLIFATTAVAEALDNRPIIVLRVDDCPASWRTPFPELNGMSGLEYGKLKQIPITWAIITDRAEDPSRHLTWNELKDYLDTVGGEAASHSVSHSRTYRVENCIQEVIDSKIAIEANLPGYSCTTFLQPGTWFGDANMDSFAKLNEPLGLAIQANYAQSMAYLGGGWRIGNLYYPYGMTSTTSVSYSPNMTPDSISATLDVAAEIPGLVCIMMTHGVQKADGTQSGTINADVLKALMDKLAELRDQGKVRLMGVHDAYNAVFSPDLNPIPDGGFEHSSPGPLNPNGPWFPTGNSAVFASGGLDNSRYAKVTGSGSNIRSAALILSPGRYELSWYQKVEEGYPTGSLLWVIMRNSGPKGVVSCDRIDLAHQRNSNSGVWERKTALVFIENEMPTVSISFSTASDSSYGINDISLVSVPLDPSVSPANTSAVPYMEKCTVSWDTPIDADITQIVVRYGNRTHPRTPHEGTAFGTIDAVHGSRQEVTSTIDWAQQRKWVYFSVFGIKESGEFTPPDLFMLTVDKTPPRTQFTDLRTLPDGRTLKAAWISWDPDSSVINDEYCVGTAHGAADVVPWTSVDQTEAFVHGLPPGHRLYFSVKARNLFGFWSAVGSRSFLLSSEFSQMLNRPDGEEIVLSGIVSAVFDGYCYIQQEDRARGIRIIGDFSFDVGDIVGVTGTLTTVDGERAVIAE